MHAYEEVKTENTTDVGSADWGRRVRRKARDYATKVEEGYMELARLLYTIYDAPMDGDPEKGPIYRSWGFESFDEYVRQDLNIEPKRAQRLRRIWYRLEVDLGNRLNESIKSRLVALGFSKVRELVRVINQHNAEEWIEQAEQLSHSKLCQLVNQYLDRVQEEYGDEHATIDLNEVDTKVPKPEALKSEAFRLYPEQAVNVEKALETASRLSRSDKKSHNLDLICTNFLATHAFTKEERVLEEYLDGLQSSLNVKLIAYDPSKGEIVFGVDTLEALARTE